MFRVQTVFVNGEYYFVCNATGCLLKERFFIPSEIENDETSGAFLTLPVALRYVLDCKLSKSSYNDIKADMCKYFEQIDIPAHPITPEIPVDPVPHLDMMELGQSWKLVAKSQSVDVYLMKNKKKRLPKPSKPIKMVSKKKRNRTAVFSVPFGAYVINPERSNQMNKLDLSKLIRKLLEFTKKGLRFRFINDALVFHSFHETPNSFGDVLNLSLHGDVVLITSKQIEIQPSAKKQNTGEVSPFDLLFDD